MQQGSKVSICEVFLHIQHVNLCFAENEIPDMSNVCAHQPTT